MTSQTEWERRVAWSQARSHARREAQKAKPVDWVARGVVVAAFATFFAVLAYIFIFGAVLIAPA